MKRSLRYSIADGVLHAVMVGASESYFGALAVQLGHQDFALAVLVTLPPLVGALSQLLASPLVAILGGRRRLVVAAASLQAISHIGIIAIAYLGEPGFWPLLLAKMAFWSAGMVAIPAWSDWIGALTADVDRPRYFARRSMLTHISLVTSLVASGAVLYRGAALGAPLMAFAALSTVALVARLASAWALARHDDHTPKTHLGDYRGAMRIALKSSSWRVAVYVAALTLGTFISAPLFTPFMLRHLGLGYFEFTVVTATAVVAKAASFPLMNRLARRVGLRPVLAMSGVLAASVPVLFGLSSTPGELVGAQVMSGVAWAGVELTSFQLLLGAAPERVRTEFLSLSNCLTGILQLVGGLIGGWLSQGLGLPYHEVFWLSAAVRLLPVALLFTAFTDLAKPLPDLLFRIVSVRPGGGATQRPIVAHSSLTGITDEIVPPDRDGQR